MITLLHLSRDATDRTSGLRELALDVMMPAFGEESEKKRAATAKELLEKGGYTVAGLFQGETEDDFETVFEYTQNGVRSDAWSRENPVNFRPLIAVGGTGVHVGQDGKEYGYKSTSSGDLMLVSCAKDPARNGLYMVASFGFVKLD